MQELLEFAKQLAKQAGKNTLNYFRQNIAIDAKADESPVTEGDRSTEEIMRREIEKRFPDDAILGEEFGAKPGTSGRRWILDPIDGTKSFIRSAPLYGTMISLEENGVSKLGVIHYPVTGETLFALEGQGCFCDDQRCKVSIVNEIESALLATSYPKHVIQHWGDATLSALIHSSNQLRTWDCYSYLIVATGHAEAFVEPTTKIWDTAPILPIIQEAGGRVTDLEFNGGLEIKQLIVTNGHIHEKVINLINQSMAAVL